SSTCRACFLREPKFCSCGNAMDYRASMCRGCFRHKEFGRRRETEVSKLAATALTVKEIADKLHISRSCVKFHLANIYRRMGLYGAGSRLAIVSRSEAA